MSICSHFNFPVSRSLHIHLSAAPVQAHLKIHLTASCLLSPSQVDTGDSNLVEGALIVLACSEGRQLYTGGNLATQD